MGSKRRSRRRCVKERRERKLETKIVGVRMDDKISRWFGYIYTYWAPLGFVIAVTMIREAIDDFRRYQRDKEVNGSRYTKLTNRGKISLPSSDLKVGDIIYVEKGHRVPADMILLRTTETSGMWWA